MSLEQLGFDYYSNIITCLLTCIALSCIFRDCFSIDESFNLLRYVLFINNVYVEILNNMTLIHIEYPDYTLLVEYMHNT